MLETMVETLHGEVAATMYEEWFLGETLLRKQMRVKEVNIVHTNITKYNITHNLPKKYLVHFIVSKSKRSYEIEITCIEISHRLRICMIR